MRNFFQNISLIPKYIRHQIGKKTAHSIHSPFVFELYTQVLASRKQYYAFGQIDALRHRLWQDHRHISVTDFGAGSQKMKNKQRKVSDIAKYSAVSPKKGALLFRLVEHFQPELVFELGTSLGIGTLYLQKPSKKTKVTTFEGCEQTAEIAKEIFQKENVSPKIIIGNIDITLEKTLKNIKNLDFAVIDANHTCAATLKYFELLSTKLGENALLVIDDIRWSVGMEQAWETICKDKRVTLSLDFFDFGLLFFRKKQPKQHFKLYL